MFSIALTLYFSELRPNQIAALEATNESTHGVEKHLHTNNRKLIQDNKTSNGAKIKITLKPNTQLTQQKTKTNTSTLTKVGVQGKKTLGDRRSRRKIQRSIGHHV